MEPLKDCDLVNASSTVEDSIDQPSDPSEIAVQDAADFGTDLTTTAYEEWEVCEHHGKLITAVDEDGVTHLWEQWVLTGDYERIESTTTVAKRICEEFEQELSFYRHVVEYLTKFYWKRSSTELPFGVDFFKAMQFLIENAKKSVKYEKGTDLGKLKPIVKRLERTLRDVTEKICSGWVSGN